MQDSATSFTVTNQEAHERGSTLEKIEKALAQLLHAPSSKLAKTLFSGSVYIGTEVGLTREENQDRVLVLNSNGSRSVPAFCCVILVDGMGGMQDGGRCAELSLVHFVSYLIRSSTRLLETRIVDATHYANNKVFEEYRGRGGATLSAFAVDSSKKFVGVNVGDSRIYTTHDGGLEALTTDDTLSAVYGSEGKGLIQFMGVGDGLKPHLIEVSEQDQNLFITSDGIHYVDNALLGEIFIRSPDPRASGERALALARWLGSPDNASIIALDSNKLLASLQNSDSFNGVEVFGTSGDLKLLILDQLESTSHVTQPEVVPTKSPAKSTQKSKSKKINKRPKPEQVEIELLAPSDEGDDANS